MSKFEHFAQIKFPTERSRLLIFALSASIIYLIRVLKYIFPDPIDTSFRYHDDPEISQLVYDEIADIVAMSNNAHIISHTVLFILIISLVLFFQSNYFRSKGFGFSHELSIIIVASTIFSILLDPILSFPGLRYVEMAHHLESLGFTDFDFSYTKFDWAYYSSQVGYLLNNSTQTIRTDVSQLYSFIVYASLFTIPNYVTDCKENKNGKVENNSIKYTFIFWFLALIISFLIFVYETATKAYGEFALICYGECTGHFNSGLEVSVDMYLDGVISLIIVSVVFLIILYVKSHFSKHQAFSSKQILARSALSIPLTITIFLPFVRATSLFLQNAHQFSNGDGTISRLFTFSLIYNYPRQENTLVMQNYLELGITFGSILFYSAIFATLLITDYFHNHNKFSPAEQSNEEE
ncbi:MAG: hypothetical protein CXT70_02955 [Methanobacteriota archaeon]|nr:MAG: hypothetical protein CXT70_02955 [Euryarchaeota archaeon]